MEKADSLKLATTLKVCHNQFRALREETEGEPTIRSNAEAEAKINEELASLCVALKKLPSGAKRHIRELFDKHLS